MLLTAEPHEPIAGAVLRMYAKAGATTLGAVVKLLQRTCTLELDADHPLRAMAPVIVAYWHEWGIAGFPFLLAGGAPIISMVHPTRKLMPWAELGRRWQWDVVLGSTGHRGRAASDEIVAGLRRGASTFLCPDGPAGPRRTLHRGVLHMAAQSGAPIVPVQFECAGAVALPYRWDRLKLPLPGAVLRAKIGAPIFVGADIESAAVKVTAALG